MAEIQEMAESLGQALGRTAEYRTLARAIESADNDREIVALTNEVQGLQEVLRAAAQRGEELPTAEMEQLEAAMGKLQATSVYQSVVAAQANFDRIMHRVDAAIQEGMRKGAASPIILTT
jgi:cell fate (sporulation/competence/biofilm development) regulator YlbF (YheA/YmcA/DUF963 family)